MKRGFLLKAKERKPTAKRQTEPPSPQRQASGLDVDKKRKLAATLAYGNLTQEEKALPSDYDPKNCIIGVKESDPKLTDFEDYQTLVTTIPNPELDDEPQSEWIVYSKTKRLVLNAPGYPARIPKPRRPDLCHVKSTSEMGQGLFAKRNIKRGDLILAERPLIVAPRGIRPLSSGAVPNHYTPRQIQQVVMHEFEKVLETAVARLPTESQADFKALHNAHTNDGSGPLLGIMRSNSFAIDNLYDGSNRSANYGALCKIGSRINHSCIPNVKCYFKRNSFSMQFYAIRDIKAEEQLFYAYCTAGTLAQRKTELAPYDFICKCPVCLNATPETDHLRSTFADRIAMFVAVIQNSSNSIINEAAVEDAVRLEKDMVKEGLDAEIQFVPLLTAICLAYDKLGKLEESEKYGALVESFKDCFKSDG